jgi:hypothetical protein
MYDCHFFFQKSGGSISNVLLSVDIPIISDYECNAIYTDESETKPKPIYESMLCAGGPNGLGLILKKKKLKDLMHISLSSLYF